MNWSWLLPENTITDLYDSMLIPAVHLAARITSGGTGQDRQLLEHAVQELR
jgi:hypothetical protein